jgi:Sec1 family
MVTACASSASDVPDDSACVRAVGMSEVDAQALCRRPANQIVVVIIGGTTYSESDVVRRFNASRKRSDKRCSAILGSTRILNTSAFVGMLKRQGESLM